MSSDSKTKLNRAPPSDIPMSVMTYPYLYLDTGDLLLFSSRPGRCVKSCKRCDKRCVLNCLKNCFLDCFHGLIKCCTHSVYTHVGVVVKNPKFAPEPLEGLYLLQSTGLEPYTDAEDGMHKFGVQLTPIQDVFRTYSGKVYWRRMINTERNQEFYKRLTAAHSVVHNRPYDVEVQDWLSAAFHRELGNMRKRTTFFCSALAAFIYTALEILPAHTPWTEITPDDFSYFSDNELISPYFDKHFDTEKRVK